MTRGWRSSWLPRVRIRELEARGVAPVFVHYFFGDEISRERIEDEREEWHASLRRLGRVATPQRAAARLLLQPRPPAGTAAVAAELCNPHRGGPSRRR